MLTQAQWFEKLQGFVPKWFFEDERYNVAEFQAIARLLAELDAEVQAHIGETYLLQSAGQFLMEHGRERNIKKLTGELDYFYARRIQGLINQSNKPSIKEIVDNLLITGESVIIEHGFEGPYCNRATFCNRDAILNDRRNYNYFTVLIDKQIPVSNSFCNRETYADRSNFAGTIGALPPEVLLAIIVEAINKARAAGVFFRLIEH